MRLKDLSVELGLSITTVSRALAGYPDVSRTTRERVRDFAERVGYVPSRAGRALVSGNSGVVGLILPRRVRDEPSRATFVSAYLGEIVTVVSETLADSGLAVSVATPRQHQSDLDLLHHLVDGQGVDGVVLADRIRTHEERVSYLIDRQLPFVAYGRVLDEIRPHSWLDSDGVGAFAEAARMLVALGHREFGLMTFAEPLTFARHRQKGLEDTLREYGIRLSKGAVASIERFEERTVASAAFQLLTLEPRPTAILCVTDALALKLVEFAAGMSIRVPDDLSVIGFDNVSAAAHISPGLSTFDQRVTDSATEIGCLLKRQLDQGTASAGTRIMAADFVARGSHGRPPAGAYGAT
ncbi:MAG: LacI family DNA-binding transcriptional regulator [Pseudomonadota bacterium]